jgi:hypothetical protein
MTDDAVTFVCRMADAHEKKLLASDLRRIAAQMNAASKKMQQLYGDDCPSAYQMHRPSAVQLSAAAGLAETWAAALISEISEGKNGDY